MNILFTGDVSFTGVFSKGIKKDHIFSNEIIDYFNKHDYVCINLEGPLTSVAPIYDQKTGVVSPVESIEILNDLGVTHYNLANNHTFDCGLEGFLETKELIEKNNAVFFGAGTDLNEASKITYIENSEIKIAILAVGDPGSSFMIAGEESPGVFSENHLSHIKKMVHDARAEHADFVIVCFHNGTEFNYYPVTYIKDKLRRISDFGVDLVVGHHPHVIQPVEYKNDRVIAYSLGNFIFDLPVHDSYSGSLNSLLLSVTFHKNKPISINYKTTQMNKSNAEVSFIKSGKLDEIINEDLEAVHLKHFIDNCRVILTGLPLDPKKRLVACALYPVYLLYKVRGSCYGNAKALIEDSLDYIKLGFLKGFIKTKNYLNKSNEF